MVFQLSKTTLFSRLQPHSKLNREDPLLVPRRRFHIEPGAREKALLEEDPALKKYKSYKRSVWRLKRVGDVPTIVVVAGCCYEIYVRARMKKAAVEAQAKILKPFKFKLFNDSLKPCFSSSSSSSNLPPSTLSHQPSPLPPLNQCSTLFQLKQIHAQFIIQSTTSSPNASSLFTALIRSYISFHNLSYASALFARYPCPPSPSPLLWNLIIQAYSKTPNYQESIHLFRRMLALSGAKPDKYTFTFVITACSRLTSPKLGESIHGQVVRSGSESNVFVGNSMVNMYSVFGRMDDALKVFDEMPVRDVVTWTSVVSGYAACGELSVAREFFNQMPARNDVSWAVMIAGYVGCGRYSDALGHFHDMLQDDKTRPNEAVLVCVLSACAHLGALDQGKWIHIYIDKSRVPKSSNISTALIDMYAKCGKVEWAKQVFDNTSERDVLTWTSMISGLAMHGCGSDALQVFSKMLAEGVRPDNVTLMGVLNGCSHSGLVDEGYLVFHNMNRLWELSPRIEHYGCLIDLLGRAGRLEEAYEVVRSMPMEPDIVVWRALLSACRIHGHVDLGKCVIDHIAQLDPSSHGGGYMLLSNLYASVGRWDEVATVRKVMNDRVESNPGCSWIEVNGVIHEFLSADRLHPQIEGIHGKLNEVLKRASIEGGYIANTRQVLFDLSEEEREQAIAWHSEKLAIAFGLMSTDAGSLIRIVKNLRICEDCHSAMKAISLVFDREIVMRDRSRFHTFKRGNCSCADYW
ncbi:hypothetical protein AAC387_Pa03g3088 [Persea americana]